MTEIKKDEILSAIEEYNAIRAKIKELEKALEPFKEQLEAAALDHDCELTVDQYTIKLIEMNRETVNTAEAKKEFGDKFNKFIKVSNFTQLRIFG